MCNFNKIYIYIFQIGYDDSKVDEKTIVKKKCEISKNFKFNIQLSH